MGFSDTLIARSVPRINHMQVYNYRHKLNISTSDIVNRRYDIWVKLIYKGISIGQIAKTYDVTERSVKVLLWKNRHISLVDVKAKMMKLCEENQVVDLGGGIPSVDQLGLSFKPITREETAVG